MKLIKELKKNGKVYKEGKNEIWLIIPYEKIRGVIKLVFDSGIMRISSISGYDNGKEIEVLYIFVKENFLINIKVPVPKNLSEINTITDMFPGAFLLEKELSEMLGVKITGQPEHGKLFLPDDFKGKPPLRK